MNKFFFILILFLFSCSGKEDLVDIEAFLKEGKKIDLIENKNLNSFEVNLINKIKISNFSNFNNWSEKNQNYKNLIQPIKKKIIKKRDSINLKVNNFIVNNNKLIFVDQKSNIHLYNNKFKKIITKKIYNRKIYRNYTIDFSLSVNGKSLFISDSLGNVHCFNLEDLKLKWSKSFGVPFKSDIKIYKKNLFVINSNSKIFSINTLNGNLNWSFESSSKSIKDKESYRIAFYKNKVFFTNDSSEIYCLDLDEKKILWSFVFQNDNFENAPLISRSSPITIDQNGILFVSNNNGNTYAIESETGSLKWSNFIYSNNRFVISENYLLNVFDDSFFILDKKTGKVLLNKKIKTSNKRKKKFELGDILVTNSNIYLFEKNGFLITSKNNNLNNIKIEQYFKKYKNFAFSNNDLYINTGYSILKY